MGNHAGTYVVRMSGNWVSGYVSRVWYQDAKGPRFERPGSNPVFWKRTSVLGVWGAHT